MPFRLFNAGYTGVKGSDYGAQGPECQASGTGGTSSTVCNSGQYSSLNSATNVRTCPNCPAGTWSTASGTPTRVVAESCTSCNAATTKLTWASATVASAATSVSVCVACAKGSFIKIDTDGSSRCTLCPYGTYSTADGSLSCTRCPAGQYTDTEGSTDVSACKSCPAGKYAKYDSNINNNRLQLSNCVACPVGYTAADAGSSSCVKCPAGSTSTDGLTCTACAAGKYSKTNSDGTITCENCGLGFYSAAGSASCTLCPENQGTALATASTPAAGVSSDSCTPCGAGSYAAIALTNGNVTSVTCTLCPVGYYSTGVNGTTVCTACPTGERSHALRASCHVNKSKPCTKGNGE